MIYVFKVSQLVTITFRRTFTDIFPRNLSRKITRATFPRIYLLSFGNIPYNDRSSHIRSFHETRFIKLFSSTKEFPSSARCSFKRGKKRTYSRSRRENHGKRVLEIIRSSIVLENFHDEPNVNSRSNARSW